MDAYSRRRTSSLAQMVDREIPPPSLQNAIPPGGTMPFMGGLGGQVPPAYAAPPMAYMGGYGGLGLPGGPFMPPPSPYASAFPFGAYPNQVAPPGNFNTAA